LQSNTKPTEPTETVYGSTKLMTEVNKGAQWS